MQLPMQMPTPEEQQRMMGQLYRLVEKQVQSYQKHRHMGKSTSIPMELAQELMESIEFTTRQVGGVYAHADAEKAFILGQGVLKRKIEQTNALLDLVGKTAPRWQTECRWEALSELKRYLEGYDFLHLAHRGPDTLFYPILIAVPEEFRGIDLCLFYLNVLLAENRIMQAVPERILENFWDRLPDAAPNQCEHVLINGIGKALL